jgi:hypothetical protein
MSVVLTIPQTTVPVGPGSATSGAIPSGVGQYVATITMVGWPNANNKAFDYSLDCSLDGGTVWQTCSSGDVFDTALKNKAGNATTSFKLICVLTGVGVVGRKVRLSWNFAKALTISGTVEAN